MGYFSLSHSMKIVDDGLFIQDCIIDNCLGCSLPEEGTQTVNHFSLWGIIADSFLLLELRA